MDNIQSHLDSNLRELIDQITDVDLADTQATSALKKFEVLSKARPLLIVDPEPDPIPVPVTKWEKFKAGTAAVWDNETTRVLLKAGGAFGGVALVVWSTVHRDHVMDRQALAQANQRNS